VKITLVQRILNNLCHFAAKQGWITDWIITSDRIFEMPIKVKNPNNYKIRTRRLKKGEAEELRELLK